MISTLAAACVILLGFHTLMRVSLSRDLEWDVSPLALLFLTMISAGEFRMMIHRRLT